LLASLFVALWIRFVQAPFEEKEMRALFGESYTDYARAVPMLLPFTTRKRKRRS
jgi:protein-S-isoprenylcysteine O-methyltransferase Ste14